MRVQLGSWRRHLAVMGIPLGLLLGSFFLFVLNVSEPGYQYFDEVRYVPAGIQIVARGVNENWSHPPLAKALIGLGVAIFGDRPLGWRIANVVAGSLGVLVFYFLSSSLLGSRPLAVFAAALLILGQFHFLQSRVATLDVSMALFMMLGAWIWIEGHKRKNALTFNIFSAICFGIAGACKWFGLALVVPMGIHLLLQKKYKNLACITGIAMGSFFASQLLLLSMRHPTYAPVIDGMEAGYSLWDLFGVQIKMLVAQINFENKYHFYRSSWWGWPFGLGAMWLDFSTFQMNDKALIKGILYIGNPLVLWLGVLSLIVCTRHAWGTKDRVSLSLVVLFFWLWMLWLFLPRSTAFLYYYYPASILSCLICARAAQLLKVHRHILVLTLATSALPFLWLYPVLTGRLVDSNSFPITIIHALIK